MTEGPNPLTYPLGVVPSIGFVVKTITTNPPKNEEGVGKVKIVLEAEKDEVRAGGHDITSILGALNMHQSTGETVALGLRFST